MSLIYSIVVAIAVAAIVLLLVVLKGRGTGGRGDLLGPPKDLGRKSGLAAPQTPTGGGDAPMRDLPEPVAAEARRLMAQNLKLEAIKRIREETHWSLGEAKAWVERQ